MKKIILLLVVILSLTDAKGEKVITAEQIVSIYADYKLKRDERFERNILQPRFKNFANFLYQGVVELKEPNKSDALAYCATLSLLSKQGRNIILPTGYEKLGAKIKQEVKLILNSKRSTISPLLGVRINYTLFRVPPRYKHSKEFYRAMKFAQTMPFFVNYSSITKIDKKTSDRLLKTASILHKTITSSERLTNLYNQINSSMERFVGVENDLSLNVLNNIKTKTPKSIRAKLNKNPKYPITSDIPFLILRYDKKTRGKISLSIRLFPTRYTLDSYIFANTPKARVQKVSKPRVEDIIKIISPKSSVKSAYNNYPNRIKEVKKVVDRRLITLKSSYDYDFKIMQRLIQSNHIKAFKAYYKMTKERTRLYGNKSRIIQTKNISKIRVEANLSKVLDVMIKGALEFRTSNRKGGIEWLKELRRVSN